MKIITSTQNQQYKSIKLLASQSKARRKSSKTILEGVHLAESYLQQIGMPDLYVVSESAQHTNEVKKIIDTCNNQGVKGIIVTDSGFRGLSVVEHGIGILFVIDIPDSPHTLPLQGSAVLLENVQDPGNTGTILRTAAAAGIKAVYLSEDSVSAWSPKVLRAGMGAHFLLNIFENINLAETIHSSKVQVIATSSYAQQSIYETDLSHPTAWLFGNEGQGVSEVLLDTTVTKVLIPQVKEVESLNVSAAAAICMFEQVRQSGGTITV